MAAACIHVCEHMAIGVVACDLQMSVLAMSSKARGLLSEFDGDKVLDGHLPRVVSDAATTYLVRVEGMSGSARVAPIRVQTPNGLRAILVASTRIEHRLPEEVPLAVVVRLQEDSFADEDLFCALRDDFNLSPRDRRLVALLRKGSSNAEIANRLGLTPGTVKVYLHELYEKFDVHSRWQLLALFERIRAAR